ncbi:DUF481 domain-containing protein [Winogradskyella sp. DF17]|uniref:DUF481 domain-containing protein n=1 Tax=Winogradskyella pelagia TaxID=2819984 RepID=A0ABS3T599_9FLAO|nr:DUF481 domain-containing protein [Winogradskyella sp. DF17]MBO3117444.1 DUF481 domain-containing protein [Winogradskyella sp. DF17]
MRIFFVVLFVSISATSFTQNDTIRVKNGNVLFGEIKTLRSGVLTMETPYSDKDFNIDFSKIELINIQRKCFIVLSGGRRLTGYIKSQKPNEFTFTYPNGATESFRMRELIILDELYERFWKRLSGNIDLSYNITRANSARQFTLGGGLSYRGPVWLSSAKFTSLDSRQDNTENIKRTDIDGQLQRILPKNWYLLGNISYLSNTEQALNSRYSIRAGAGRFLALNNKLSWGVSGGLNLNLENFSDDTPDRESTEIFIGTNFNMFDFKDFSLNTNLDIFPSLSESGRWRADYNLDIKWDLPFDFYLKTNVQFNYDNQAAATGSNFDYILTTGIGWSFN